MQIWMSCSGHWKIPDCRKFCWAEKRQRGNIIPMHPAIRLESGRYIITGGAIKLTATMQEREHTLEELHKLNKVSDYLISQGIFDYNGFEDYDEESKG